MYDFEEDFYSTTNEFDAQIDEFKQSLLKSVKEEFKVEMEKLRKENQELQEVKMNFDLIKNDFRNKERELERERQELERKVRRERLSTLMKDFEVIMYRAYTKTVKQPKCDKCDDNRKFHYTTPLGRNATEDCTCNKGETVFFPQEYLCTEFKINENGNGMRAWYKLKPERDYDYASYDSSTFAKNIYNSDMKFEDIERYDTFFKTIEECQIYCDYLNAHKSQGGK